MTPVTQTTSFHSTYKTLILKIYTWIFNSNNKAPIAPPYSERDVNNGISLYTGPNSTLAHTVITVASHVQLVNDA